MSNKSVSYVVVQVLRLVLVSLTTNNDKSSTVLLSKNETMMGQKIVFDTTFYYTIKVVLMIDTSVQYCQFLI